MDSIQFAGFAVPGNLRNSEGHQANLIPAVNCLELSLPKSASVRDSSWTKGALRASFSQNRRVHRFLSFYEQKRIFMQKVSNLSLGIYLIFVKQNV